MARIRTIKPDFWTDEKMSECSLAARLFFIGTWNFADDNGNLPRSAKKLKMQIFPAETFDCEALISELMTHGVLREYSVSGIKYLHIKGFSTHQVINRRTKTGLPKPDFIDDSVSHHGVLTDGREGKGREGKGNNTCAQPAKPSDAPLLGKPVVAFEMPKPVISMKTNTGAMWHVYPEMIADWKKLFPAVDVAQQLRTMSAWLDANQPRRKTDSGMKKFIVSWLTKDQNRGGSQNVGYVPRGPLPPERGTLGPGEIT